MILLATEDGLLLTSMSGVVEETLMPGRAIASVDSGDGRRAVAVRGEGVFAGIGNELEPCGLEEKTLWRVRLGGGRLYAGFEPAAIFVHEDGSWRDLEALRDVDGYDEWESPWGEADLCCIVADAGRLIVGVEVGGVAVSMDDGATWEARNNGLFEDVHTVVADGEDLYVTTGVGTHRSHNGGVDWSWEATGIDRGYTQGIALSDGHLVVAGSSGPPLLWESGGPQGAIFRSSVDGDLDFTMVTETFEGNIERQAMESSGSTVVAGTSVGELLVSTDAGASFEMVASGLPAINGLALEDVS